MPRNSSLGNALHRVTCRCATRVYVSLITCLFYTSFLQAVSKFKHHIANQQGTFNRTDDMDYGLDHVTQSKLPLFVYPDGKRPKKRKRKGDAKVGSLSVQLRFVGLPHAPVASPLATQRRF